MKTFFVVLSGMALLLLSTGAATAQQQETAQRIVLHSAADLQAGGFGTPLLAMNMMGSLVCTDDIPLEKISAESETFECCSHRQRVRYALEVMKELVHEVNARCEEEGCDRSAIARICVDYKQVSDGKCVAEVSLWYSCCCCIGNVPPSESCSYDTELCSGTTARKKSSGRKYECCDSDARWNAIYGSVLDTYEKAAAECALLECATPMGIRGIQVDFNLVDEEEGICGATATVYYSCCCVCED